MDIQFYSDHTLVGNAPGPLEALAEIVERDLYFYDAFDPTAPDLSANGPHFRTVGIISARDEAYRIVTFYFEKGHTTPCAYSAPVLDGVDRPCTVWDAETAATMWLDLCDPDGGVEVTGSVFEHTANFLAAPFRQAMARLNARVSKMRRPHPTKPHLELLDVSTPINVYEPKRRVKR